jgi:toxin YoeB
MVKRINTLIKEAMREPFEGIGSPEALTHGWAGYWPRRLDREHRLVYTVLNGSLVVAQCRYHF